MKALSVRQPWASLIEQGYKTIETRTWKTSYRGNLLICTGATYDLQNMKFFKRLFPKNFEFPFRVALCIVELYDITPMTEEHRLESLCEVYPGAYSWMLRNIRPIERFYVKGELRLFNVEFDGN